MAKKTQVTMQERLADTTKRFNEAIVDLVTEMDAAHRCVSGMGHGLGVIKLKNGRRAEVQLHLNTDKDEWIKGK